MAKKKKAGVTGKMLRKAAVAATKRVVAEKGFDPLSAKDTKRMQALLAEIGSGKKKGFIFMSAIDGSPTGNGKVKADGIMFAHGTPRGVILGNLIHQLRMDPFSVLSVLAQVADEK